MAHLFSRPVGLLISLAFGISHLAFATERPNILFIMADDIGIEGLGSYGGESYATPNLDQLAATGLRFTHAYSQPLCTPTRLELMTGRDNHRNWEAFGILPKNTKTFGHLLQESGYKTAIAGKWQLTSYDPLDFPNSEKRRDLGTHPSKAGFDSYSLYHARHTDDKGSRYADPTYEEDGRLHREIKGSYGEDEALRYMQNFLKNHKKKPAQPFFLYYPMSLPHWPFQPTPHSPIWKEDPSQRLHEDLSYFKDMVEYMDHLVGELIATLDQLELRENTLVIFYSDNGTHLKISSKFRGKDIPGGKATPIQTGIRVPLIINQPGHVAPGISRALIDASDFLPTFAQLSRTSLTSDYPTDGVSFANLLSNKKRPIPRDHCFFWYDPRPGWDKERFTRHIFVLDHDYKLFNNGEFYHISGTGFRETKLDVPHLTSDQEIAHTKLTQLLKKNLQPPFSPAALSEVDSYGIPLSKKQ